jgi:alpha-tubulin suppressor-like RCC1 family protein
MKFKWILILIFSLFLTACQEQTTTIIFDTNGGSDIPDILLTDQQRQDELPIPEKENYLFKGWFLDAEMTIPLEDSAFETLTTFQEVILYAKWERAFYVLTTHVFIELETELDLTNDRLIDVVLGENYTVILTSLGRVFTWGDNTYGQLGNQTTQNAFTPFEITPYFSLSDQEKIEKIVSGWGHSAALTTHDRLFVWGRNDSGQLGNGTTNNQHTPQDITNLFSLAPDETITDLALGWGHSAALTSNQRLFTWGKNESGQLGNGTTQNSNIPLDISASLRRIIQDPIDMIALGSSHTGLLTTTGRLFTWGRNVYGQLGDGTTSSKRTPTEITSFIPKEDNEVITRLSLGWGHSSIQTSLDRVFIWGFNQFGQLGNQTNDDQSLPILVSTTEFREENDTIKDLRLGNGHSGFLTSNDHIFLWGFNQFGQLGNGTTLNENKPIAITVSLEPDEVITTLALGVNHSAVLTSNGRLMMWGFNQFGQLGNGTTINKNNTQYQSFYLLESIQETRVASPYVIPFPPIENMLWYDGLSFDQQLVFPLTLTSDTTIYAKPQKP